MELKVTGPKRDLHSGTYGGGVQNPLNSLATIISRLINLDTGRILIPGFYEDVRPLAKWERQEFAKLPFNEAKEKKELGVPTLVSEKGYTYREQVWARPTLDVNGIFGGYQGKGAKTVLPSWAGAKVSMRLVPDQDPARIAELVLRHVERAAPRGVRVEARMLHSARPILIDTSGRMVEAALDAMEDVWGRRPVRMREGGSIPVVATFIDVLRAPVLLLGFGLPDDRLHAPNEKLDLQQYAGGIRATARLLDRIGSP
jgi:acetylornithine deacetylase/succinyl-diaminopimelate desuccinylase-like protein